MVRVNVFAEKLAEDRFVSGFCHTYTYIYIYIYVCIHTCVYIVGLDTGTWAYGTLGIGAYGHMTTRPSRVPGFQAFQRSFHGSRVPRFVSGRGLNT